MNVTTARKSDAPGKGWRTKDEWQTKVADFGKLLDRNGLQSVSEEGMLRMHAIWLGRLLGLILSKYPFLKQIKRDLKQEANIALLKCWRVYQRRGLAEQGVLFTVYAYKSVYGTIIEYSRGPYRRILRENDKGGAFFDRFLSDFDSVQDYSDTCSAFNPCEPYSDLSDRLDLLDGLRQLVDWELTFLNLYYVDGLTLKEIGAMGEVSEGRACQVHIAILNKLRGLLGVPREDYVVFGGA